MIVFKNKWLKNGVSDLLHREGVVPVVGRAGEERFNLVLRKNATVVSFPYACPEPVLVN
eukprot:COSAG06_NODE_858_length_11909_cov_6.018036_5_plen_59_part_00